MSAGSYSELQLQRHDFVLLWASPWSLCWVGRENSYGDFRETHSGMDPAAFLRWATAPVMLCHFTLQFVLMTFFCSVILWQSQICILRRRRLGRLRKGVRQTSWAAAFRSEYVLAVFRSLSSVNTGEGCRISVWERLMGPLNLLYCSNLKYGLIHIP